MQSVTRLSRGGNFRGSVSLLRPQNGSSLGARSQHTLRSSNMAGPPSRMSYADRSVTIFGATGFVARYVYNLFGQIGSTLIVPYRGDELDVRHIKPMADSGMVANKQFSVRDKASIRDCVRESDIVINLLGKAYETKHILPGVKNYTFKDVHVDAARTIAQICKEEGVDRFVHLSTVLADKNSPSQWAASKAEGEEAVLEAFPEANIVRSAIIYGAEDRFLNWIAQMAHVSPRVPLIDGGQAELQPVFVNDVAKALFHIAMDPSYKGQNFELYGPETWSMHDIVDYVCETVRIPHHSISLPKPVAQMVGTFAQMVPDPTFTADYVKMISLDQVRDPNSVVPSFEELNIKPTTLEKDAFEVLLRYKKGGYFYMSAEQET